MTLGVLPTHRGGRTYESRPPVAPPKIWFGTLLGRTLTRTCSNPEGVTRDREGSWEGAGVPRPEV